MQDNTFVPCWKLPGWQSPDWAIWGSYKDQAVVICPRDINEFINLPADTMIEVAGDIDFVQVAKGAVECYNIELLLTEFD